MLPLSHFISIVNFDLIPDIFSMEFVKFKCQKQPPEVFFFLKKLQAWGSGTGVFLLILRNF